MPAAPDLVVRVDAVPNGNYVVSVLDGGGAQRLAPFETDEFTVGGNARSTLARFREIRSLAAALRQAEVDRLGLELWSKLPRKLREYYWREMHGQNLSVVVCSDEPSMPWELVKPRRDGNGATGPMLGLAFSMARWTLGAPLPCSLRISRFASIAPLYAGRRVRGAREEQDELTGLYSARPVVGEIVPVKGALQAREADAIHYTGHGEFDPTTDDGELVLTDASLRPGDLAGMPIDPPGRPPLVFLNACQVGRQAGASGRAGGWAAAFREAGCGAFVGPYYSVTSLVASRVSCRFFQELQNGRTLGEAMRAIRERFVTGEPTPTEPHRYRFHPTWLAYTLHGHPNAKVEFAPGP